LYKNNVKNVKICPYKNYIETIHLKTLSHQFLKQLHNVKTY